MGPQKAYKKRKAVDLIYFPVQKFKWGKHQSG